jgi:phytoene synthase
MPARGQRTPVMTETPFPNSPDRALLFAALPAAARPPMQALFALDARLAGIVRATREPIVGQMRLTWWHDALTKLDSAPAPAEPLLRDVQHQLLPAGVTGVRLAGMIDGWEELIVSDPLAADTLLRHAEARGAGLFAAADSAHSEFTQAFSAAWPARLRPIGMLSLIARLDASNGTPLAKALKVGRFRLTGR